MCVFYWTQSLRCRTPGKVGLQVPWRAYERVSGVSTPNHSTFLCTYGFFSSWHCKSKFQTELLIEVSSMPHLIHIYLFLQFTLLVDTLNHLDCFERMKRNAHKDGDVVLGEFFLLYTYSLLSLSYRGQTRTSSSWWSKGLFHLFIFCQNIRVENA